MGRESRDRIQKEKEVQALGKFNVRVLLYWLDGTNEGINVRSWIAGGDDLALEIDPLHLRCVNIRALKHYDIIPQSGFDD